MLITSGILTCGAFIGIIALIPNIVVSIAGCLGIGLGASMLIIPSMAMMQGTVPAEMRGRVSSSSMSLITLSQGIAMLFAGDLGSRFGIVAVYWGSAALLFVIALFGFFRLRRTS